MPDLFHNSGQMRDPVRAVRNSVHQQDDSKPVEQKTENAELRGEKAAQKDKPQHAKDNTRAAGGGQFGKPVFDVADGS